MTRILELNIADCCTAELSEETKSVLGMLCQSDAREYFATHIGRLQRRYGKRCVAVDDHVIGIARVLNISDIAACRLPLEKRADLLNFIAERGFNMEITRHD